MIYFISDVHLGFGSKESSRQREELLLRFLEQIRPDCECLYIVGDLFDYWFEYNTVLPRDFFRTLTALDSFCSSGIPVEYVMGNHDFGHQSFFEQELNIPIYKEDITRQHNGKKFYIAHGDGKVYNDQGYLILRAILRNKLSIKLYQWLHPDIGIWLASGTSHKSRTYTDAKDYGKPDGLADFADKRIQEGFDYVIMGHQHQPLEKHFGNATHTGTYINLGEWMHHRTFAMFDGTECKLLRLDDFLK